MRRTLLAAALSGVLAAAGTAAIGAVGSNGAWVASEVERSGGGGRHGGSDD